MARRATKRPATKAKKPASRRRKKVGRRKRGGPVRCPCRKMGRFPRKKWRVRMVPVERAIGFTQEWLPVDRPRFFAAGDVVSWPDEDCLW